MTVFRRFLITPVLLAACASLVLSAPPAAAQAEGIFTINRVNETTPRCADHPTWGWRGRVSGNITNLLDGRTPVSFVGCFPDRASCETWRGRASGAIDGLIIQNSCRPR